MKHLGVIVLAIAVPSGEPPTEICLFKAGENTTRKGTFLFDAVAAKSVMAAYEAHGIDLMFDLEHLSLDDEKPNFDPDARGWARLELRAGALWAVGITWTADGEARLREKRQRYISPAFRADPKTRRVTALINVAITALPATDHLTPLVAAAERGTMDPKLLESLGLPPEATLEDVLAAIASLKAKCAEMTKRLAQEPADPAKSPVEKPAATTARAAAAEGDGALMAELAREVRELRAGQDRSAVQDIILANRAKFTPALEKWALTQTPKALTEFIGAAPALPTGGAAHRAQQKKDDAEVKLTAQDKKICRMTGTTEAAFLAAKMKLTDSNRAALDGAGEDC